MKNYNENSNNKPVFRVKHDCKDMPKALGTSAEQTSKLLTTFRTWVRKRDVSLHTVAFEKLFELADTIEEFSYLIWVYAREIQQIQGFLESNSIPIKKHENN